MTGLEVSGMVLIILGVVGMLVMFRGKRPSFASPTIRDGKKEKLMDPNRRFYPFKT
jgi:hypothetical protein